MYARHFMKMFLWLVVMAAIGVGGLVLANYYSGNATTNASTAAPSSMGN